jgi:hypothetical protein
MGSWQTLREAFMRRAVVLAVVLSGFVSAAEALTIRDVIDLTRAGLGEDVLLALIEVDRGIYAIDPATLKALKQAGVSERVIVALVRSGREPVPEPPPVPLPVEEPPAPEPRVVVIEHHQPPQIQQVVVPVPIYVPVATPARIRVHRDHAPATSTVDTFVPFQSGPPVVRPQPQPSPVYWGHGGKLRPDAWGQPRERERDSAKEEGRDHKKDKK